MVAVGILTYVVVFNLNQIVKFWKSSYRRLKSSAVKKMQADERSMWKEMGDLFQKYKPRNTNEMAKPSEWWIPIYMLRRILDLGPSTERLRQTFRRKEYYSSSATESSRADV